MKMKSYFSLVMFAALFAFCSGAWAITNGVPDCQDNSTNSGCAHPNVVSLTGFKIDPTTNQLVSAGRCTGSVLKVTDDMLIVLTAGHCAATYSQSLANGTFANLGVSFDALIQKPDSPSFWGPSQYLLGGQPLVYKQFGPTLNSFNVQFDYGLIAFPLQNGFATTVGGTSVDVNALIPVTLPSLGLLDSFQEGVTAVTNVGYGTGSVFTDTGRRIKPVSPVNFDDFGVREISANSVFINFHGTNQNLMLTSMNPALGNNGTCGGDSGGPQFYVLNGQELVVSVTSSGDSVCRSTNITARLDINEAQNFIQQCAYAANSINDFNNCSLGCTVVSSQGVCN